MSHHTNSQGAETHDYIAGFYIGDRPKVVTSRFEYEDSHTLERFLATDGYEGLKKCLTMSPQEMHDEVRNSTVLGRGGAGFPAGVKWGFTPQGVWPRYLVVNGDESEPGTYKDRLLMERDPHQLIEGCLIACYAAGLSQCFLYVRGEMAVAQERIAAALNDAYAAGYIGKNILGTDFSVDIVLHWGAGAYVVGEETALIESLEGERGMPRLKPPFFPAAVGLYGKPTIVNNVETLCNIPHIIDRGADWFKTLGVGEDSGTKLFGVSGKVNNPGCWELPMGTPIREIIDQHAGGMRAGFQLKGFLPGGGSTDFLVPEHLDLAMDYNVIGAAGSRMGTGTMIILDDRTCPVGMVLNLIRFFAQESCGFCTPCRDGLPWSRQVLEDIENGAGRSEDLETLAYQVKYIGAIGNTHCALAPGAMEPLQSAMKYFYDDFVRHIDGGHCPYHNGTGAR